MVAMEPPVGFDAAAIRKQKSRRVRRNARGQAGRGGARPVRGRRCAGQGRKAYRDEPDVAPGSNVETYVAMRFEIDNWRWAGVPFYFRTGKHLSRRR